MRPRRHERGRSQQPRYREQAGERSAQRYYPLRTDVEAVADQVTHAGLLLDRFAGYPSQDFRVFDQERGQKEHIKRVVRASKSPETDATAALAKWDAVVAAIPGCRVWHQATLWRLALHLSRASSLENGSVCLHPVYGFAYLPGTGLKGLAHAYASLTNANHHERRRIFGFQEGTDGASGSVVFLDAWPQTWPRLEMDIVNSHHSEYYSSEGAQAPGDWESPIPVYFLAVAPGTTFRFAVYPRDPSATQDAHTAARWLQEALQELGAGAKTAAGYGYFGEPQMPQAQPPGHDEPSAQTAPLQDFEREFSIWVSAGKQPGQMSGLWNAIQNLLDAGNRDAAAQALNRIREADPKARKRDKFVELAKACGLNG